MFLVSADASHGALPLGYPGLHVVEFPIWFNSWIGTDIQSWTLAYGEAAHSYVHLLLLATSGYVVAYALSGVLQALGDAQSLARASLNWLTEVTKICFCGLRELI